MITQPQFRKVFEGVATRRQMFLLFDRHAQAPMSKARFTGRLHEGEWFEIGRAEHDYMFDLLPPLWMRGDMFALREFMAGSITSIFFALPIGGRIRYFHGYCDLSQRDAPEHLRQVIVERESRPAPTMTRAERLDHIWSITPSEYREHGGETWTEEHRGQRTIRIDAGPQGMTFVLLDQLTDEQIEERLPAHLRHLPAPVAA
jgi:hypothetical protein